MKFGNAQSKFSAAVPHVQHFNQSSIGQGQKTRIRAAAFIVALLMVVPPVFADTIKIRGTGALNCAKWTQAKDDPTLAEDYGANVQWVLGFLVGFSYFRHKSLLQNTDYDAVAAYVDNKCKLKPLADIMDVAVELGNDLAK
jgi:hypothetical protein